MSVSSTLLIVDDSSSGREILRGVLSQPEYELVFAKSGAEALKKAAVQVPDVVLLDVMMPEMDGFEVCRRLRRDPRLAEVPVIMITALDDRDSRLQGIEAGADDFISKPFDRTELRARVRTVTQLNRYRRLLAERAKVERLATLSPDGILVVEEEGTVLMSNTAMASLLGTKDGELVGQSLWKFIGPEHHERCTSCFKDVMGKELVSVLVETEFRRLNGTSFPAEVAAGYCRWDERRSVELVVRDVTDRKRAEAEILSLNDELLEAYDATLEGWVRALDLRDKETEGHTRRVTDMTVRLARAMGVGQEQTVHIRRGALLHDMGKIGVADSILLKEGPLTDDEWEIMRKHPTFAYEMLAPISFLQPALDVPHYHHERWDGSGYPEGIKGKEIPQAARIFAVVDVWDALRSDRPYRKGWPDERVRDYVAERAGTDFDPDVVAAFLQLT